MIFVCGIHVVSLSSCSYQSVSWCCYVQCVLGFWMLRTPVCNWLLCGMPFLWIMERHSHLSNLVRLLWCWVMIHWYSMAIIGTSWSVAAFSMKDGIESGPVALWLFKFLSNLCTWVLFWFHPFLGSLLPLSGKFWRFFCFCWTVQHWLELFWLCPCCLRY